MKRLKTFNNVTVKPTKHLKTNNKQITNKQQTISNQKSTTKSNERKQLFPLQNTNPKNQHKKKNDKTKQKLN